MWIKRIKRDQEKSYPQLSRSVKALSTPENQ